MENNITNQQLGTSPRNNLLRLALFVVTALFVLLALKSVYSPQKKDNQIVQNNPQPTTYLLPPTSSQLPNTQKGVRISLTETNVSAKVNQEIKLNIDLSRLQSAPDAVDVLIPFDASVFQFINSSALHTSYTNTRKLVQGDKLILSFVRTQAVVLSSGILPQDFLRLGSITFSVLKSGTYTLTPLYNTSSISSMVVSTGSSVNQLSEVLGASLAINE